MANFSSTSGYSYPAKLCSAPRYSAVLPYSRSFPEERKESEKEQKERKKRKRMRERKGNLKDKGKIKGRYAFSRVTPHSLAATPRLPPSTASILGFKAYHFDRSCTC